MASPARGGIQPGSSAPWLSAARSWIGAWRPGSTLTPNGRDRLVPNGNGSSTATETRNEARASGGTTHARGPLQRERRSGSVAVTTTSTGALPRLSTSTSWRPVRLPREVWGTISAPRPEGRHRDPPLLDGRAGRVGGRPHADPERMDPARGTLARAA